MGSGAEVWNGRPGPEILGKHAEVVAIPQVGIHANAVQVVVVVRCVSRELYSFMYRVR